MADVRISRFGDAAWLLTIGSVASEDVNLRVLGIAEWIWEQRWPGVLDVVPGMASLAVHVKPDAHEPAAMAAALAEAVRVAPPRLESARLVEVPVVYGGTRGPDLERVASLAGLTADEVAHRHAAPVYRVFILGFLPGFPYLGVVDPSIRVPRHPSPRQRVPAGAVGIAGAQTGIYPSESPGGWQIIGQTPIRLFNPDSGTPVHLRPGDRVRFVPIEETAFEQFFDEAWR